MDSEHIESIRQNNIGIMLVSLIAGYDARLRQAYAQSGFGDVRRSHGYVLRNLEQDGSRVTDIARRAGITKQTAGKIVQELERLGYVTVAGISGDSRVRLVCFSERGRELVNVSQALVAQIHETYASQVGAATFERFEATLRIFIRHLAPEIPQLQGALWASANPFFHFGRFMVEIANDFENRLRDRLAQLGFSGIKHSYLAALFHLDLEGSRVTALAQRVAVSPQAASLTLGELARAGFIKPVEDPGDQRARLILLTARGLELMQAIATAVEAINQDYASLVGLMPVTRLRDCLLKILRRLRISVFV